MKIIVNLEPQTKTKVLQKFKRGEWDHNCTLKYFAEVLKNNFSKIDSKLNLFFGNNEKKYCEYSIFNDNKCCKDKEWKKCKCLCRNQWYLSQFFKKTEQKQTIKWKTVCALIGSLLYAYVIMSKTVLVFPSTVET